MNEIINLRDYATKGDVTRDVGPDWQYMGRTSQAMGGFAGSPLANPFPIGTTSARRHATAQYRPWLWQQMQQGHAEVLEALRVIGPQTVLACWCEPRDGHCTVIARAAAWLRRRQPELPRPTGERPRPAQRPRPPLPTRYAPGQRVGDTHAYCAHHTHAKLSRFQRGTAHYLAHRLDSGKWCSHVAEAPAVYERDARQLELF